MTSPVRDLTDRELVCRRIIRQLQTYTDHQMMHTAKVHAPYSLMANSDDETVTSLAEKRASSFISGAFYITPNVSRVQ